MFIRTRLASAGISLEARVPTKDYPLATHESLSFELLPTDERDHLDLDTGEVFQDYNYASLHKKEKKLIDASLTIHPSPNDAYYHYNVMHYSGEVQTDDSHHPSQIYFTAFIEPTAFRELVGNVKVGLFPETITIEFEGRTQFFTIENADGTRQEKPKQALEFGWEPDGSGMIWHNTEKENLRVPIKSVRFDYSVLKAQYDEKRRTLPMRANAPAERIIEQTAVIRTSLAEMLKYLRWIATIMVVLATAYVTTVLFVK